MTIAPLGLKIEPLSSTELKLTPIQQPNTRADLYQMTFQGKEIEAGCRPLAHQEPRSCFYRDLQPGTEYTFIIHARAYAAGFDIVSDTLEFSGTTPPDCEHMHSFLKSVEDMFIINIICDFLACFTEAVNCSHAPSLPHSNKYPFHSSPRLCYILPH